jgi:hypothetical protein
MTEVTEKQEDIVVSPKPKPLYGRPLYLSLAQQAGQTASQNHLLFHYANRCDKDGRFSVGIDTIAKESHLDRATIFRANAVFKAAGILTWEPGRGNRFNAPGKGTANRYQFDLKRLQEWVVEGRTVRLSRN